MDKNKKTYNQQVLLPYGIALAIVLVASCFIIYLTGLPFLKQALAQAPGTTNAMGTKMNNQTAAEHVINATKNTNATRFLAGHVTNITSGSNQTSMKPANHTAK